MAQRVNNVQLFYDNKSACLHRRSPRPNQLRPRVPFESKLKTSQLNFLKIMMRMPRPNAITLKPAEEPVSPHVAQERMIVISSIKNPEQSPETKHFRIQKQLKRYISDEDFGVGRRLSTTKSKPGIQSPQYRQVEEAAQRLFENSGYLPALSQKETQSPTVKTNMAGDYTSTQLRAKYKIVRQTAHQTIKQDRKASKIKGGMERKQEAKGDSKYPVLSRTQDDLKEVKSQSWVLMEYPSKRVIVSNRSNNPLEIASLTKIMTFYTVIQVAKSHQLDIKTQKVTISEHVTKIGGTSAELNQGQQYTLFQLLHGLMLPSGNDAANQLAYWAASLSPHANTSDPKILTRIFVSMMNTHAKNLGLKHTKFGNPHGLPHPDSRSTATDVAKLSCACLDLPYFQQITNCKSYKATVPSGNQKRQVFWQNTNKLLRRQGFIGLKTGITVTAGPCLACAYKFRNKIFISVILRSLKVSSRFRETRMILHWSLTRLYKDLSQEETQTLRRLKRHNHDLDSDNSQDQHVFKYDITDGKQFRKRCHILNYEM